MRTRKCAGILGGCLILILFSLITIDWAYLIFIPALLILLFVGVISFVVSDINLEATRKLSNVKIFEDDKIEVTLELKNLGRYINFLEIFDTLPDRVLVTSGSNYSVLHLKKKEEVTIKYQISCPIRGRFQIGPLKLRIRDYFGMFYKELTIADPIELIVIPHIEEIGDIEVKAKANIYPGMMQVKQAGIGIDFYGIRKYTTSDTFKRINWKSFARWNNLMVNEFELESTTDVVIMIDSRESQNIGTIKHNPIEYNVKAALSIASKFLKRRDRVGLIIYGKKEGQLKWIYPDSGKKQLNKLIKEIVEIKAEGEFSFWGAVEKAVAHMLPKKSLIILISSLEKDLTIPETVQHLIALRYNVLIVSPSPIDIEYTMFPSDKLYKIAYKILSLERKNFIVKLRNNGARVIDWNPTLPLTLAIKEVEKYQTRR